MSWWGWMLAGAAATYALSGLVLVAAVLNTEEEA